MSGVKGQRSVSKQRDNGKRSAVERRVEEMRQSLREDLCRAARARMRDIEKAISRGLGDDNPAVVVRFLDVVLKYTAGRPGDLVGEKRVEARIPDGFAEWLKEKKDVYAEERGEKSGLVELEIMGDG